MKEIWKEVKGYEGIYCVSNLGRVRRVENGSFLKTKKNNRDYVQVRLYKNGDVEHWLLHRLVAFNFIDNPNELPQINHKDENKDNNRCDNLEWCDNMYNRHYGTGIERMSKNRNQIEIGKKYSKPVLQFDVNGNFINQFYGVKEAERQTGITESNIRRSIYRGYYAGGYKWEYA